MAKGKYARKRYWKRLRETMIRDCELSTHTIKALEAAGIETLADLIGNSEPDIQAIRGIGEKAMEEIRMLRERNTLKVG